MEQVYLKPKPYAVFLIIAGIICGIILLSVQRLPIVFGAGVMLLTALVASRFSRVKVSANLIVQEFFLIGIKRIFTAEDVSAISMKRFTDSNGRNWFQIIIYNHADKKIIIPNRMFDDGEMLKAEIILKTAFAKKLLD